MSRTGVKSFFIFALCCAQTSISENQPAIGVEVPNQNNNANNVSSSYNYSSSVHISSNESSN